MTLSVIDRSALCGRHKRGLDVKLWDWSAGFWTSCNPDKSRRGLVGSGHWCACQSATFIETPSFRGSVALFSVILPHHMHTSSVPVQGLWPFAVYELKFRMLGFWFVFCTTILSTRDSRNVNRDTCSSNSACSSQF